MMYMASLVKSPCCIHLLVNFDEEQSLEYPKFGWWPRVSISHYLPSDVPNNKVGKLGGRVGQGSTISLIQSGCTNGNYHKQEKIGRFVGGKGWLVQDG